MLKRIDAFQLQTHEGSGSGLGVRARQVFDRMDGDNDVSLNSLINGYAKNGDVEFFV